MTILDIETGQEIARLLSSIGAAQIMYNGNCQRKQCYWLASEYRAIVELKEKYGIPHSGYELAKEGLKKDFIANASL